MGHAHWEYSGRNIVITDGDYSYRWLDAVGPGVTKVIEEWVQHPRMSTTDLGGWTDAVTNATFTMTAGELGGSMVVTTAGADDDGVNSQIAGEAFLPNSGNKIYYGIRLQCSDATQSDFFVGLAITDGDCLGGVTDGIYFRKVDGSTACTFVVETGSTETETAACTIADATYVTLEWVWTGSAINFYVDGVLTGTPALTNIPTTEYMTPTMHLLAGEAAAKTFTIAWMRCIQVREGP